MPTNSEPTGGYDSAYSKEPKEDTYRGKPMLRLPLPTGREFSFGLTKAKAILRFYSRISQFVADHE